MAEQKEEWRGKIGGMSQAEIAAFLAGNPLCRLACLDETGWPYVVPIWYEYQDGGYYLVPRARSKWAAYLKRDKRASLCIDTLEGMRKVLVKGEAKIVEEPNVGGKWVEIARSMSRRYLGPHGPDYIEPTMQEPRWLIFVTPVETTTWQGVDWAKRYKHTKW
jgi:nitroimidazol reductase NimA-like FMN-containing flavoprotein (pyridoxamine 5'-phosphate oxidase superfamily)